MLTAVLSGFVLAVAAPFLYRLLGRHTHWLLALLPAALTVYFAGLLPQILAGETITQVTPWLPALDLPLSFHLDGLSLLFALLICGIGTFILLYAGAYLAGHRDLPRFYVIMLSFMASMLGVVLSDNMILMFVFWELTSVTSYLLIGFNHEDEKARKSALQGLIVTAGGGLALLAGLVMLAMAGGTWELSEILGQSLQEHDNYVPLLVLILLGAFTKSAQFPFHFWLPNAMAAPTPVSAYLHSATMVKAGIYLLARLNPTLGGTELWTTVLGLFGAVTLFTGAFLAYQSADLKRVLAFSTVMALGTLVMLIGLGGETGIFAAMTFLLAHSLYKGGLFMVAGAVDHSTGTKQIAKLGGLRGVMPLTAAFALLGGLSLAGIPPLFGFIGKELMFEALLAGNGGWVTAVMLALAVIGATLVVGAAGLVCLRPFVGDLQPSKPQGIHEAPLEMLIGPAVLTVLGLVFGLLPFLVGDAGIVNQAAAAVYGGEITLYLALWHGFNLPLLLSALCLLGGVFLYLNWIRWLDRFLAWQRLYDRIGPERGYWRFMDGLVWLAKTQTRLLQSGSMRTYMLTVILTTMALIYYTLFFYATPDFQIDFSGIQLHELAVATTVIMAAIFVARTRTRLAAVAALGIVGFSVALVYVLFSAPDLGITQILVETLTVLLLVLVLFRLPRFLNLSSRATRARDTVVAVAAGGMVSLLMLATLGNRLFEPVSDYFIEQSVPTAHGRNIVNVILVDFRALDTLGEIFVLALVAIGIYAMIRYRAEDQR